MDRNDDQTGTLTRRELLTQITAGVATTKLLGPELTAPAHAQETTPSASASGSRTIVIYSSDHSEMGGAHGLRGKGPFAYEESIHLPFHVVHPDVRGGTNRSSSISKAIRPR